CMTVNVYGNGEVYYLGCYLDDDAMLLLAEYLGDQVGLELPLYEQKGVETVDAGDGKQDVRFIMNHNAYPVTIAIKEEKYDLIAQKKVDRTIELEPYGVAIVK
ncbi:MAG: Beta-galactosidase C-terminal domain, partial [Lachnospiraceae bacterium]|nr:Beta-galactosidase C-terminal domain [Lachnospiraceae bacterium]